MQHKLAHNILLNAVFYSTKTLYQLQDKNKRRLKVAEQFIIGTGKFHTYVLNNAMTAKTKHLHTRCKKAM